MSKIKIAHVITTMELGGAQKTTLSLLRSLDSNIYELHLLTSGVGLLSEKALEIPGLKAEFIPSLVRELSPVKDVIAFWKIYKYLREHGILIVHTHSSKAGILGRWAAKCAGAKSILHTVHGWPFNAEIALLTKILYRWSEKLASLITDKLVVVSDSDLKDGLKAVDNNKQKYKKISYGIEIDQFKNIVPGSNAGAGCRVGYISCFKPQKAPLDFVRVAKYVTDKNKSVKFISAGDGTLRSAAEKLTAELGLSSSIKFLGWQTDIAKIFSAIDILLLTSRWEGLPVVFLEAMASGIPIVATRVGGAAEVIENGKNGFLEDKGDYKKLAEQILLLAGEPEKRRLFGVRAKERFREEFDISYMSAQTQALYNQLIQNTK